MKNLLDSLKPWLELVGDNPLTQTVLVSIGMLIWPAFLSGLALCQIYE